MDLAKLVEASRGRRKWSPEDVEYESRRSISARTVRNIEGGADCMLSTVRTLASLFGWTDAELGRMVRHG